MAIDVAGADTYFATQLTSARWTAITLKTEALAMAITEIATALGFSDDTDLDEDDENYQNACYEQSLFLGEKLTTLEGIQLTDIGNLQSQQVDSLGEETYKTEGKVKSLNGIILSPRAQMYLKRIRGPFKFIR